MPMLAHFEDRAPVSDRRRAMRRALLLGAGAGGEPVTIHDLSLTGALLETTMPMLVGQSFEIELSEGSAIPAVIVWNSGEFYGCQFDLPISPSVLSAALLQSQPPAPNEPADPLAELKELNTEVERLALKMDRALRRLTRK